MIRAIKECAPDLIVFTGDVVDERHSDITPLKELLEGIYDLAPIYYVSGNHDLMPDALPMRLEMHQLFQAYGVINLDDQSETLERQGETILLTGLGWHSNNYASYLEPATQKKFNILFHHGSNYFPGLSQYGYDLILAGHIHGGIVRLPLLGGVFSNEGTLFPTYDAGLFLKNDCTMISSRGLGDARIPRFYNRPEIVSITLHP